MVRTAIRPSADLYLPETLLQEAVRMGEPALMPMQERWVYDPTTRDIPDLLERRVAVLRSKLTKSA